MVRSISTKKIRKDTVKSLREERNAILLTSHELRTRLGFKSDEADCLNRELARYKAVAQQDREVREKLKAYVRTTWLAKVVKFLGDDNARLRKWWHSATGMYEWSLFSWVEDMRNVPAAKANH